MISRRKFLQAAAVVGAGGAVVKLGAAGTPFPEFCDVRDVRIPAPAGWAGRTALFITDVHFDHGFGPAETVALSRLVRSHRPDVVLMGGDLAHAPDTDLSGFFSHWSPGCPVLFAPGNHDMAGGADSAVMRQARAGGMTVLCNAAEQWNGIAFVGLASALRGRQRLALLDTPGFKIVLGHEPDMWVCYTQPDLLHLAGHTHGGQARMLGRPLCLPALGKMFCRGDFFRGTSTLIVSAGVGSTVLPVRIHCPPEIIRLGFV